MSYVCELVCMFVCTIVGASPTPACYVGQVSVCIQLLKRGSVSPNTEEHGAMLKPTLRSGIISGTTFMDCHCSQRSIGLSRNIIAA